MAWASSNKQIIYSGIQPTGVVHLGNYLGALSNWVHLQTDYSCIYCIVDLHALTVRMDSAEFSKKCRETFAMLIAVGIDPARSILYMQSQVAAHSELAWILNCYTYMGELNRMTQYKEKSQKNEDNINAGLFTYPVLQAADILLYKTNFVPIGEDQRQHLELSRDVAERFNNVHGGVFVVPDILIPRIGARIKSLQDPEKKMSKSDKGGEGSIVYLTDEPDVIRSKIKKAVTDSDSKVSYSSDKPGVSNLLDIYAAVKRISIEETLAALGSCSYGALKEAVAEAAVAALEPIKQRYAAALSNKIQLESTMRTNAGRAQAIASGTMIQVRNKLGLL
ncbi:MAG: tryptophan--tRNA ligase [Defluviitaleaceae bacterium]|nr:tryptophan--tRNA ligase [Defluviitaleaceae bacterium]